MKGKSKALTWLGQDLMLLFERALYWRQQRMLIVADPHFGKAQIFRDRGIPVPAGTTAADLQRLSSLINQLHPEKLLFLGDLIHGRISNPSNFERLIGRWRRLHKQIQLLLVTGNHDLHDGEVSTRFGFDRMAAEFVCQPFVFTHQPQSVHSDYRIAGHLHPAVSLTAKGRLQETLPCFCFGARMALLPAFGGFTGTQVIRPAAEDRIFVIAEQEVFEIRSGGSR